MQRSSTARVWLGACVISLGCGRVGFDGLAVTGDGPATADDASIPCTASAIPAYVQGACGVFNPAPGVANVSLPTSVSVSNVLIVVVDFDDTTSAPSLSDSLGHSFRPLSTISRSASQSAQLFYVPITVAGSDTVTVSFGGSVSGVTVFVQEYSGVSVVTPVDTFQVRSGNGMALTTNDLITTTPGNLLFAHGVAQSTVSSTSANLTTRQTCNANRTADGLTAQPGAYRGSLASVNNGNWIATIAAFHPTGCP